MDRRAFVSMLVAGATSPVLRRAAYAQPAPNARNVVLVHGLFADGSCWSEVIARLQPKGVQVTAVQNPLTTLQASVEATQDVLALQQGPTVLVAHSFGGMIITEAVSIPRFPPSFTSRRARPMRARITPRSRTDFQCHRPPLGLSGRATMGGR